MAALKEVALLVVDVGPTMTPHLPHLRRALLTFLHSKLVDKTTHQAAIVLAGTAASANALAEGFGAGQYTHITTVAPLGLPTIDTARELDAALAAAAAPGGAASADFLDALAVGWDVLYTGLQLNAPLQHAQVRIVIVSDFVSPSAGDSTAEFIPAMVSQMSSVGALLEMIRLDVPLPDPLLEFNRAENLELMGQVRAGLRHLERVVTEPGDLAGVFRAVEPPVQVRACATLHLELGEHMKIPVKLALKTVRATAPSLGVLSPLEQAEGGPAGLVRSTVWYREDDPDMSEVPLNMRVGAYRYGKDVVPFDDDAMAAAKYVPEKGLRLLGFLPAADIPRQNFVDQVVTAVADKNSPAARAALAALVRAMAERGDAAIVRLVRYTDEKRAKVEVCAALPVAAAGGTPDHLLIVRLPFWEDVRPMCFPSLDREGMVPTEQQCQATLALVDAMSLEDDELAPEHTVSPALHRFSTFAMLKAIAAGEDARDGAAAAAPSPFPDPLAFENDTLLQRVMRRARDKPGVAAAVARAAEAFPTGHTTRQLHAAVHHLRPGHGEEDLCTMVEQGNMTEAVTAARREVERLVKESVGDSGHGAAVLLLRVLRDACVAHRHAAAFNRVMFHFEKLYAADMTKRRFWKRAVVVEGLAPVSAEEAAAAAGEEGLGGFGSLMAAEKVTVWKGEQLAAFEGGGVATGAAGTQQMGSAARASR